MQEKVAEYAGEGAEWPRTACILDPVRASVVCSGPAQMLEVGPSVLSKPNAQKAAPQLGECCLCSAE